MQGFVDLNSNLHACEKLLFPPQMFVSSALQYAWAECSICKGVYGECDHLSGSLYMGKVCTTIVHEITGVDHIAIVAEPDDKRLRFPSDVSSLTGRADKQHAKGKDKKRKKRK